MNVYLALTCLYSGATLLCPSGMMQCDNATCLEFERFCDGVPDCIRGADESTATCGGKEKYCIHVEGMKSPL